MNKKSHLVLLCLMLSTMKVSSMPAGLKESAQAAQPSSMSALDVFKGKFDEELKKQSDTIFGAMRGIFKYNLTEAYLACRKMTDGRINFDFVISNEAKQLVFRIVDQKCVDSTKNINAISKSFYRFKFLNQKINGDNKSKNIVGQVILNADEDNSNNFDYTFESPIVLKSYRAAEKSVTEFLINNNFERIPTSVSTASSPQSSAPSSPVHTSLSAPSSPASPTIRENASFGRLPESASNPANVLSGSSSPKSNDGIGVLALDSGDVLSPASSSSSRSSSVLSRTGKHPAAMSAPDATSKVFSPSEIEALRATSSPSHRPSTSSVDASIAEGAIAANEAEGSNLNIEIPYTVSEEASASKSVEKEVIDTEESPESPKVALKAADLIAQAKSQINHQLNSVNPVEVEMPSQDPTTQSLSEVAKHLLTTDVANNVETRLQDLKDALENGQTIVDASEEFTISEANAKFMKNNPGLFKDHKVTAAFVLGNHLSNEKEETLRDELQDGNGRYGLVHHEDDASIIQVKVPKVMSAELSNLLKEMDADLYNLLSSSEENAVSYLWLNVRKNSEFHSKLITKDENGDNINPWINPAFADLLVKTYKNENDGVDFLVSRLYVQEFVGKFAESSDLIKFLNGDAVSLDLTHSKDEKENVNTVYNYLLNSVDSSMKKCAFKAHSVNLNFHSHLMSEYGINIAGQDNEYDLEEMYVLNVMQEILTEADLYKAN